MEQGCGLNPGSSSRLQAVIRLYSIPRDALDDDNETESEESSEESSEDEDDNSEPESKGQLDIYYNVLCTVHIIT